ncbi:electron transport complex subunit RsxA [Marispirochaeta aestuarii]|jgi:electron transport complex protein RnfA|uniref:electron transport complex subunit RsxA n=1 Tax=Marispirochaeta aestuarii TaxID=1963862 RepID=UPI0029C7F3BE|nr:electron transport complex subunit RsxA [Marispirochaeta aestuarii]
MIYIGIFITFVFINNFILTQFLGICPFIGVSKNVESAVGMGFAVIFVMSIATLATWIIYHWILVPLDLTFLRTISFILVIASLVQLVEMVIQKVSPALYKALGIYLPLITTNCAVMGMAVIAVQNNYNALESFIAGFSAGVGFLLAIVLMSTIREKLDTEWIPKPFQGVSIAFITGGLMAMAFMAFDKTLLNNLFPGL